MVFRLTTAIALSALLLPQCATKSAPQARITPPCTLVRSGYGPVGKVPIRVETVVSGLEVPWGIAFLPGGDWLVTERPGRLRLVHDGRLEPPIATLAVTGDPEGGLLGVAVHPDFRSNGFIYLYETVRDQGYLQNRVIRYRLSTDHRSIALDRVILRGIRAAAFHNGGRLRFGPDGMLYVGTGDARLPETSQSLNSPNGKLLRVTPEGAPAPDNPFPRNPVFLLGIRNTQGFDWLDQRTLLVVDHGPTGELGRFGHDEVNVVTAGQNLGWPQIFGCESAEGKVTPSLSWDDAVPPGGAAVYTGSAIPEWRGSLLLGTLKSKHLHRVAFDAADPHKIALHEVYLAGDPPAGYGRLREVIMGPDGDLYVTTSNCDGRGFCGPEGDRVLRITR